MLIVLDALRGLAALFVVLHHAYGLLWSLAPIDGAAFGAATPAWALTLTNPLRFGRLAVMLFFILSGFCIHYRQAVQLARWDRRGPPPRRAGAGSRGADCVASTPLCSSLSPSRS
jgi:peptidoglycan/LPS O-acetylase OafA/YrhL